MIQLYGLSTRSGLSRTYQAKRRTRFQCGVRQAGKDDTLDAGNELQIRESEVGVALIRIPTPRPSTACKLLEIRLPPSNYPTSNSKTSLASYARKPCEAIASPVALLIYVRLS